jgi:hypothetical protein
MGLWLENLKETGNLEELSIDRRISHWVLEKKSPVSNFTKIHPVETVQTHVEREDDELDKANRNFLLFMQLCIKKTQKHYR